MNSGEATTQTQAPSEAGMTVFRYKLKPMRDRQWQVIQQSLGCQRWVYNQGVALQESLMGAGKRRLPYKDLCKELTIALPAPTAAFPHRPIRSVPST